MTPRCSCHGTFPPAAGSARRRVLTPLGGAPAAKEDGFASGFGLRLRQMPWSVDFDAATGVVHSVFVGELSRAELMAALAATLEATRSEQSRRVFADCSALTSGHSLVDLYDAAVSAAADPEALPLREAVLIPKSEAAADLVSFWETAATNRGLQVRTFTDRAEALAWLTALVPGRS